MGIRARDVLHLANCSMLLAAASGVAAQPGGGATANAVAVAESGATQVTIVGQAVVSLLGLSDSASEGIVSERQLADRPLLRSAEVMEAIPGMSVTQHSGDGKANQYFLRGFNLDHGSDFATFVDGMPINVVSHAHGQGYTDLNFLIPELIGDIRFRKGSYAASDGVFAVTGAADIDYVRSVPMPFIDASAGSDGYRRMLAVGSRHVGESLEVFGAVEAGGTDGPWEQPEKLHKFNTVLRVSSGDAMNGWSISGMSYLAQWIATEEVPERAVDDGEIGRFGTFAPTDGGRTYRDSLSFQWARSQARAADRVTLFGVRYGLDLFSTPSAYLDGQHEQLDRRSIFGGSAAHTTWFGPDDRASEATLGVQVRRDDIPLVGLYQTVERVRTGTVRADRLTQDAAAVYVEEKTPWTTWLRTTLGLRYDRQQGNVASLGGAYNSGNGGRVRAGLWSPKAAIALGPFAGRMEFYADWGVGFHSNDFRGATTQVDPSTGEPVRPVAPLVKAIDDEIGLRTALRPGWNMTLAFWQTRLASELVFSGDEGVTEPLGASRRHGVEWATQFARGPWVADADLALSRARFDTAENGGTSVPNAIPLSAGLGATWDAGGRWYGSFRMRYLGAYPLEETAAHSSIPLLTTNARIGWRIDSRWRVMLDVLNLFDRKANDIAYWGTSCTRTEFEQSPSCNGGRGVDGVLDHPMEPREFRLSVRATL